LSVDCPFGPAILLQGGAAGRLVTSSDPESLASALEALAADPDQRTRYAEAGRRIAESFTITRSLEAYSEALLAVLHDDLRAPRAIHETL
jgi:glycosyltransferase involved in cell wall biosynthesis